MIFRCGDCGATEAVPRSITEFSAVTRHIGRRHTTLSPACATPVGEIHVTVIDGVTPAGRPATEADHG